MSFENYPHGEEQPEGEENEENEDDESGPREVKPRQIGRRPSHVNGPQGDNEQHHFDTEEHQLTLTIHLNRKQWKSSTSTDYQSLFALLTFGIRTVLFVKIIQMRIAPAHLTYNCGPFESEMGQYPRDGGHCGGRHHGHRRDYKGQRQPQHTRTSAIQFRRIWMRERGK